MNEYTAEMLEKLELCGGCLKSYYFEGETKTCAKCIERGKNNRLKTKESVVFCNKEGCKFKRSKENEYCKLHQICIFENETKAMNKKLCANYIRGCRNKLELEYQYTKCGECLEIARNKDKQRRLNIINNKVVTNNATCQIVEKPISEIKSQNCTSCFQSFPMEAFIGHKKQITKTCKNCRDNNKKVDSLRDKEHRNKLARKNESKPERIEVKNQWKENNYEKVAECWMNSRQKKMENLGVEQYLKEGAEYAKKWRNNNPEKVLENNEYKKNSKNLQYNVYSRNAALKNLEFTITYEEFANIIENPCYYCNTLQTKGFNGIDRKDQTKGYIRDNCVSCCKMCNYIKGSLSDDVFIKRIIHILKYNNLITDGHLYTHCFANHNRCSYLRYQDRALCKKFDFLLTPSDYENIVNGNCYICGKENDDFHTNGIDRIDSKKGYILENVKPCCGECNFMKLDYEYKDFISKLQEIYENHKHNDLSNSMIVENNNKIVKNKNKKTKEEINSNAIMRKQNQMERLKEKYNNEEYKQMRAQEIAKNRKEKIVNK